MAIHSKKFKKSLLAGGGTVSDSTKTKKPLTKRQVFVRDSTNINKAVTKFKKFTEKHPGSFPREIIGKEGDEAIAARDTIRNIGRRSSIEDLKKFNKGGKVRKFKHSMLAHGGTVRKKHKISYRDGGKIKLDENLGITTIPSKPERKLIGHPIAKFKRQ